MFHLKPVAALAAALIMLLPLAARAVPEAYHVRCEVYALRLTVNDFTVRHQVRAIVTVSSSDESQLAGLEQARLKLSAPSGEQVLAEPVGVESNPKQFKAGHVKLLFKLFEDSTCPALNTVPAGFFSHAGGPFQLELRLPDRSVAGTFSFSEPVGMQVTQAGAPVANFSLADEKDVEITTTPAEFGPVYYKRQDVTNLVFQLASMDQALESGDYHPVVESPKYIFQIRVGDASGGVLNLIDPSRYIEGYEPHLIRSDRTTTPLYFSSADFQPGQIVALDFMRQETLPPDSGFRAVGNAESLESFFSSQIVVQNRVVYAMSVETAPTNEELGLAAISADAD